jgi:hypothetical protein
MSQIHRVRRLLFMTIRSILLFAHLVGMLALFAGLAIEWLCVERLSAPDEPGPFTIHGKGSRAITARDGSRWRRDSPVGDTVGAQIGVLRAAFVGMSFAGLVLMTALGGIALRPLLRAVKERRRTDAEAVTELRQLASRSFLRTSLQIRVLIALTIVYLMVAKPL